jgi:tripartite-type tricarboxylate transporter receptor subunit TctC
MLGRNEGRYTMIERRRLIAAIGAGALAGPAIAQPARAAWQPSRPVQCIIGFAPGGGADQIARAICEDAGPLFTQPLVVTNRPGAGGSIAAQFVATQPPDGHTLFMAGGSETTSLPAFRDLPYDPKRSFRAVMRLMRQRLFIFTRTDGRFATLPDAIAAARARPGTVSYGTSGIGSIPHAAFLVLERQAQVEMLHSPYTGGAPSVQAVAARQIDLAAAHPEEFRGLADAGLIRVLAVASTERAPQYPDAPTLKELGYDAVIENMKGWVVPAGTPDEIVGALHDRFRQAMAGPAWRNFLERAGDTDGYLPGPEFQAAMDRLLDTVRVVARPG